MPDSLESVWNTDSHACEHVLYQLNHLPGHVLHRPGKVWLCEPRLTSKSRSFLFSSVSHRKRFSMQILLPWASLRQRLKPPSSGLLAHPLLQLDGAASIVLDASSWVFRAQLTKHVQRKFLPRITWCEKVPLGIKFGAYRSR